MQVLLTWIITTLVVWRREQGNHSLVYNLAFFFPAVYLYLNYLLKPNKNVEQGVPYVHIHVTTTFFFLKIFTGWGPYMKLAVSATFWEASWFFPHNYSISKALLWKQPNGTSRFPTPYKGAWVNLMNSHILFHW